MGETVLITGGSHAEIPLINAIQRLGFRVLSTGINTDGLGHKLSDIYVPIDYSDKEAILDLAIRNKVSGIVSGCNDFAYLSTSYVCEVLGIGGHDNEKTAEIIHLKNEFRFLLEKNQLPHPKYKVCNNKKDIEEAKELLKLPVFVKPTDLTGGKGISVCYNWNQVFHQFDIAHAVTRRSAILVEEKIEGSNHGVSVLIRERKVCFSFFDNEEYYLNPYLVSGAYSPSDLAETIKNEIIRQIETIANDLRLCDGLFHCQCIVRPDGMPYLIDPCRRAPGDLYIKLVSYATGIDYPMAIVKSELGMPFEDELNFPRKNRNIARECIMADKNGKIKNILIPDDYNSHIIERIQWGKPGDQIDDYLKYKAGIVFFEYPVFEELRDKMKILYQHMRVEVETEC